MSKVSKTTKATERKPRDKKAQDKPKRGRTPYILFMSDQRPLIIREHPNASFADITRIGSEKWKSVTPAAKKKYEDLAAKDKARYEREMASYVPDPAQETKKTKRVKDPNAPKRALTGYMFYVKSRMNKNKPQGNMKDYVAQVGADWKKMSEKEKAPFLAQAQKDKARYEREMASYTK